MAKSKSLEVKKEINTTTGIGDHTMQKGYNWFFSSIPVVWFILFSTNKNGIETTTTVN
jgi:hypothetical protein